MDRRARSDLYQRRITHHAALGIDRSGGDLQRTEQRGVAGDHRGFASGAPRAAVPAYDDAVDVLASDPGGRRFVTEGGQ